MNVQMDEPKSTKPLQLHAAMHLNVQMAARATGKMIIREGATPCGTPGNRTVVVVTACTTLINERALKLMWQCIFANSPSHP